MRSRHTRDVSDLIDLVRIFDKAGPIEPRTVSRSNLERTDDLQARLYRAVRDSAELSESELALRVFNDSSVDAQKFSRLKSRLKLHLLDALPFLQLDRSRYSPYLRAVYEIGRSTFLSQILLLLSARDLAASLARKSLPIALRMEEWGNALQLLTVLRADAMHKRKTKLYHVYADEYLHCERLLAAENLSKVQAERIQMFFANHAGPQPGQLQIAHDAATAATTLAVANPSFKLAFNALRLRSIAAQVQHAYTETIRVCDEVTTLLNRYPQFLNRARRGEFAIDRLVAAVHLRSEHLVQQALRECRECFDSTKNNWFVYRQFEFIHLMHTECFKEAMLVVEEILAHKRYPSLSKTAAERWQLFRLYAEYANGKRVPIREVGDFGRLLPTFTADKTGLNTSLIVLHVLLLAERGQFADLVDRAEFIRGYRKRFLRGPEHSHASHFFRMIASIELADLSLKKLDKKSRALYLELQRMERQEPIQGEVILPYTWVWARLRELLREYHPLVP